MKCKWVDEKNELYVKYHDEEWGVPSFDDAYLFEMLVLELFQAGLSWITILKKREAFRKNFDYFDVQKISEYDDIKIEQLMQEKGIIRNRLKIKAAIQNAKVFIQIQIEYGSFSQYIWGFTNNQIIHFDVIKTTSELSDRISRDLKEKGMCFVGSTIIYSYLQAIGIIDDHEECCDLYWKRKN